MFSRRNLTPYQRSELALELEPLIREKAEQSYRENVGRPSKKKSCQNSDTIKVDTKKELSDTAGVSHDTIMRSKYIKEHADEAKVWIIENQLARRNLPDHIKLQLRLKKKDILAEGRKKTQGLRTDIVSENDTKLEPQGRVQKQIADELGWSTGKVAQGEIVLREAYAVAELSPRRTDVRPFVTFSATKPVPLSTYPSEDIRRVYA